MGGCHHRRTWRGEREGGETESAAGAGVMRGAGRVPCGEREGGRANEAAATFRSSGASMPTPCVARTQHTTLKHTLCAAIICARRERSLAGNMRTRVACVSSTACWDRLSSTAMSVGVYILCTLQGRKEDAHPPFSCFPLVRRPGAVRVPVAQVTETRDGETRSRLGVGHRFRGAC